MWTMGFSPEHISVGCGSVSLCQQLIQITCTVGDEVLYGWRSFEIYPLQVRTAGATPVQVPLTDHTYDLDAMLAAITDRTRLIFVCNPNNPTSTVVDPDKLARFVEAVPPDILIALDEAYVEYIRDGMLPDSFGLVRAHSNVVVLRTFSKAYGLAGLRIGYAVGDPDIITALGKVYVPFTATSVSQAAAIASLDAADELLARTDAVVAERARVTAALREAGYTVPPSQANFVWLPLPGRAQEYAQAAANSRIIVRPYGEDGVRVTVAAPHENDAFLEFARRWIGDAMTDARKKFAELKERDRPDSRCRTRRLLGHARARRRRLHDRRVEGRRVRHRPPRERRAGEGELVRQDVRRRRPTSSRWSASTTTATSSPTSRWARARRACGWRSSAAR